MDPPGHVHRCNEHTSLKKKSYWKHNFFLFWPWWIVGIIGMETVYITLQAVTVIVRSLVSGHWKILLNRVDVVHESRNLRIQKDRLSFTRKIRATVWFAFTIVRKSWVDIFCYQTQLNQTTLFWNFSRNEEEYGNTLSFLIAWSWFNSSTRFFRYGSKL